MCCLHSDPMCHCGHRKSQHNEEHRKQTTDRWGDNTRVALPDAFGEILFIDYNQRLAKVRCLSIANFGHRSQST